MKQEQKDPRTGNWDSSNHLSEESVRSSEMHAMVVKRLVLDYNYYFSAIMQQT